MTTYVGNAFALSMLTGPARIETSPASLKEVGDAAYYGRDESGREAGTWKSVFGHADVARLAEQSIGLEPGTFPVNRVSVHLADGDCMYVAQYVGPRLPDGATALPTGAAMTWVEVRVNYIDRPTEAKSRRLAAEAAEAASKAAIQAAFTRGYAQARKDASSPAPRPRTSPGDDPLVAAQQGGHHEWTHNDMLAANE